jgi:16S rRNA (uracil1498-N3)-methyltransferase
MPHPRFFVDSPLTAGESLRLPAAVAHHALRVLRLRGDAPIVLFNGRGGEYAASLLIDDGGAMARVDAHDPIDRESPLKITLIQALVASDKLDWIVEKAVELGVDRIVIAPTRRSVVRLDARREERRLQRWRDIVLSACCQCGRNRVPEVDFFPSLEAALTSLPAGQPRLMLLPSAGSGLPRALPGLGVALMVGPEGGFSEDEEQRAAQAGFVATRIGPRILRTETAGLAALAALQATVGDLAGASARPLPSA